jgi:copper resistance protein B
VLAPIALAVAAPAVAQDHAHHHRQTPPAATATAEPSPALPDAGEPAHAADSYFDPDRMAQARAQLRIENGGVRTSAFFVDRLEARLDDDGGGYAWAAQGWYGGDIHRFWWKSEGDGGFDAALEHAEAQLLYSRAVTPHFDVQAGLRQTYRPEGDRTALALGVQGLAPYWFEVSAEAFVSTKGELTARAEAEYDLRLTQRLIVQPRAEINVSARDIPAFAIASGVTDVALGVRVRHEVRPDFAPYVGLEWEGASGRTRDLIAAHAEDPDATRLVIGVHAFF